MMTLDDYRNIPVSPNYEKPRLLKKDIRHGKYERFYHDVVSILFLTSVACVLFFIAMATMDLRQACMGFLWLLAYILMTCLLSVRRNTKDGYVYLLVDKIMELDEDMGLTQCLFILYEEDKDVYCKVETDYHLYREARVGDWVYMYATEDNIFVIPEYPNAAWLERKSNGKRIKQK